MVAAMISEKSSTNLFSISAVFRALLVLIGGLMVGGCHTAPQPGAMAQRTGDEIMVAGHYIHTGTPVVLWTDPGGYDAYRVERRFSPLSISDWQTSTEDVRELQTPNRYSMRKRGLTTNQIEQFRGGGWDLATLQKVVDQFVIHFDVAGVSRQCFNTLHDHRDLSVHFMLDIDGTIYQTLDLKERAWHATIANDRSVGIEIANMGAYGHEDNKALDTWYSRSTNGQVTITIPENLGDGGVRTPHFVGHPVRPDLIKGNIQGHDLVQYDFTPEQYAALVKLTATLCTVFPKIQCRYPTDESGKLITKKLPDDQLKAYEGVLGHYHIQTDKVDPGPAFNWDYVIGGAQKLMNHGFTPDAAATSKGNERAKS
jgi:N-acetyl-anhydromuramyl-L-alanine amidase AmpD